MDTGGGDLRICVFLGMPGARIIRKIRVLFTFSAYSITYITPEAVIGPG